MPNINSSATRSPPALAIPTPAQYQWHEQERIMFIHYGPATWQGLEYDDHSTPLTAINPTALDTHQWCRAALAWGAKQIIFVAKHTGRFCWWQTDTSPYGIKETPWKNGKGDVLAEIAEACRLHGLNLGVYLSPADKLWDAGVGSPGRTKDPAKQEAYAHVYRQQLTEVLSRYGKMHEVWFDGSCLMDVGDILTRYAPDAAIFQGPMASIRWCGTESGRVSYPAWNSLKRKDLASGVATVAHSDPDGDAWAPLEVDTTLYSHWWFWSKANEAKRKSLAELMDCYYKSVGRGGVLLINATPNTDGLIPALDMALYQALGQEIQRRFSRPRAEISDGCGNITELLLPPNDTVNHTVIMEDYRQGERIRAYKVEGLMGGEWRELCRGTAVGRMKIDVFPPAIADKLRLRVTRSVGEPIIRRFAAFHVEQFTHDPYTQVAPAVDEWHSSGQWSAQN
ncbi:MAG: alpha-L-fucosidase, partial [Phycisphaerae bacterium]|nr:alpha-L-fucosidase [Phycisphaerae bacterium]